jgi:hypothetical protein
MRLALALATSTPRATGTFQGVPACDRAAAA